MIRVVRGASGEAATEALVREARSDGGAMSAAGRALEDRLGPEDSELLRLDDAPAGSAFLGPAGRLDVAYLIHVVLQSTEEPVTVTTVERGLTNALRRASAFGILSLALPPMGVGAGNLDAEQSAAILTDVLSRHLQAGEPPSEFEIRVTSEYEEEVFRRHLDDRSAKP